MHKPITAIGQNWPSSIERGVPSRKTPLITTIKKRIGFIIVIFWIICGMLAMGVVKPESMIAGTTKRNAPRRPCCWFTDMEEIIYWVSSFCKKVVRSVSHREGT